MKKISVLGIVPVIFLGACATVPPTSAEIESCRKMESEMGVGQVHDHNEMKGRGLNPMNLSHARCMEILKN
ncbi:hypothetical protein OOT33_14370 [Sphingobium sp. DEHP117]|uniref:hypothetical protein n=1 Tax=Sphingobium sp. DEHP117 TaxID=2993436 RepID=UPI0027D4D732|nr:hypothetical protein [Sphingobium sp. DEHP117]MDQ4421609.1 hypothetical protein [Sphingobium sp. DEHP117]